MLPCWLIEMTMLIETSCSSSVCASGSHILGRWHCVSMISGQEATGWATVLHPTLGEWQDFWPG